MQINQPATSIKLTNVSIVRMKKGGKRFEIACYKNKVTEWRNKSEKDLDNVLQIPQVFVNVSKGQVANSKDLVKAFDTDKIDDIIHLILEKGELQVGQKEREHQMDNLIKDIATIVTDLCINPETKRPYTFSTIEKVMQEIHFSVNPNKNAKQQALDVIKQIQEKDIIPIKRAQMRIRLTIPSKQAKALYEILTPLIAKIESEDKEEVWEIVCMIDPGQFKPISELMSKELKGKGSVELLTLKDVAVND
ncbi:ribosome maturation protein SBDS-like protein [Gorgonomyces haynaldii]|nr:ribosome maturation protein SBDS-like protein [Gorgonomyces haynaldii]